MAIHHHQPPAPSPSFEDEDQGSESKSESVSHNKMEKNPSDDDDEDSVSGSEESESESQSGFHKPDPTVKPPMQDAASAKKKINQVKSGAGVKRSAENEPKRVKKKVVSEEGGENGGRMVEDQKKPLFQRLWSEDDEIVILKGIRDYVAKKRIDSLGDMNAFHDFIKKSLHVDVSTGQLQDKVRRLKKKFLNNVSKEKGGKDRIFSKPHEQKSYDVSKKIWAPDGKLLGVDSSKVKNGSARKNSAQQAGKSGAEEQSGARRNVEFGRSVGVGAFEHEILNNGLEYIEGSKRVELEDKWKKLRVEEYQLYLKKLELMGEQTALVLEAMKAGVEG